METAVTTDIIAEVSLGNKTTDETPSPNEEPSKPANCSTRRRAATGRRGQRGKRRGPVEKRRGPKEKRRLQKGKRRAQEEKKEGVTVKRLSSDGKRRWDKKHYCVFCRRPQVKIARHLLRKHADEQEVLAASVLPPGSKERHLLLEQLRCRGNYLHNIEVIRQGRGEIIPWRQPSEDVDARNYLPCPLCLGFFLRADLWKHQASCRKKLAPDPSKDFSSYLTTGKTFDPNKGIPSEATGESVCDGTGDRTSSSAQETLCEPSGDTSTVDRTGTSDSGTKRPVSSDPGGEQPRKRCRVQAAASRLLPISSGASESCSEILHRMNQDHVSHQVKSDWLICKYGNQLLGSQDVSQKRYEYVSQKLRKLGKFLLAAKSLDSGIRTLQDILAPGRLSLALAAARKASGYRWSRPPLAVKTTLKTVCEIAIGESVQDGDWEAAAKTTDFYHLLGREWDNLGLMSPDSDTAAAIAAAKLKKRLVQSRSEKKSQETDPEQCEQRPLVPSKSGVRPMEPRLQAPLTVPAAPRKVHRRPWSSAEKEAVWRQLGVHVLLQTVPGKEVCQRCLDLEPVLRGRHWKDIKNQVHNQIQSQKKQQFHAQMDLQENQEQQDQTINQKKQQQQAQMNQQAKDHTQNQKKQQYLTQLDHQDQNHIQNQRKHQYQAQMDQQNHDNIQSLKKQQYPGQMDHQDHTQIHKKQLCHTRLDHQDLIQVHKKHLYQMDQQHQGMQTSLDRDTSILTESPYGPDGPHRAPGQLLDREPTISPYALPHRPPGPHMDQLLSRTAWTDESLGQNYPISRQLARNLLQDMPPSGPPPNPHIHF
ncbi:uncharacterized protein ACBR49_019195 isoform 1-T2 [Aulostomus maculatus]